MSVSRKSNAKNTQNQISGNKARDQLEKQIAEFLKSGGEIQKIPSGWSNGGASTEARQRPHVVNRNADAKK